MAKLTEAGPLLVIIGVVILAISLAVILLAPRLLAGPGSSVDYQTFATLTQLGWFFTFFAAFMIVMGVRRISPI